MGIGTDIFADPTHGTWWNSNTRMRYPAICGGMTYETHGLAGFEHHTQLPTVAEAMLAHGYSEADVVKIVGANWMRVFRAAWNN